MLYYSHCTENSPLTFMLEKDGICSLIFSADHESFEVDGRKATSSNDKDKEESKPILVAVRERERERERERVSKDVDNRTNTT